MDYKKYCTSCMKEKGEFDICKHCGAVEKTEAVYPCHLPPRTMLNNRYMVGDVLGYGGFGVTYKALDIKLEVVVAIKEYFPNLLADRNANSKEMQIFESEEAETQFAQGMEGFLDEARSLAKLGSSPNVVNVNDFFQQNNTAYIVMEYIDGISLEKLLLQMGGRLEITDAIAFIAPIADGLSTIHQAGIIHRDISLDNIIVGEDTVKIIDFGAAYFPESNYKKQAIVLKPGYAPPEQYIESTTPTPAMDIYAMGALVYIMLTGKKPCESVDRQHEDILVLPTEINPLIPTHVELAVLKAMAYAPEMRFKNILEFKNTLMGNKRIVTLQKELKEKRTKRIAAIATVIFSLAAILFLSVVPKLIIPLNQKVQAHISVWVQDDISALTPETMAKITQEFNQSSINVDIDLKFVSKQAILDAAGTVNMPDMYIVEDYSGVLDKNSEDLQKMLDSLRVSEVYFLDDYSTYFPTNRVIPLGFDLPFCAVNDYSMFLTDGELKTDFISGQDLLRLNDNLVSEGLNGVYIEDTTFENMLFALDTPIVGVKNVDGIERVVMEDMVTFEENLNTLVSVSDASGITDLDVEELLEFTGDLDEFGAIDVNRFSAQVLPLTSVYHLRDTLPYYRLVAVTNTEGNLLGEFSNFCGVNKNSQYKKQEAAMVFIIFLLDEYAQGCMYLEHESELPLNKVIAGKLIEGSTDFSYLTERINDVRFSGSLVEEEKNILIDSIE